MGSGQHPCSGSSLRDIRGVHLQLLRFQADLVSAAVESIWSDIFRHPDDPAVFEDTLSCIRWMYRQMEYGSEQYPGFFTHHALGFVRQDTADGKQQMRQTWQHILDALTMVLTRDKKDPARRIY